MRRIVAASGMTLIVCVGAASGQVLGPDFAADYELVDLGAVEGVPLPYGGLFTRFQDPDGLYIGGAANTADGALYRIGVNRGIGGAIIGFQPGAAVRVADAPFIDGGIVPDPGGFISYAQWPANRYSQIDLSTGLLVNDVDLVPFGVAPASSTLQFIPAGYPGAGRMPLASWANGEYYDISYTVGAGGIITINSATQIPGATLPGGPEGIAYVPFGSPAFLDPAMIVAEFSAGNVATYEMDANGDPIIASRRDFITGLTGAEGAWIDVFSGEFLFSTFGKAQDRVILVRGFAVPGPGALALVGLGGLLAGARRRR